MNESSITISWKKNADGANDISVSGDINGQRHFNEAFLTLDKPPYIHDITESDTSGESAGNSVTIELLRELIEIIRKSNKLNGSIVTERQRNLKFPYTDLITIQKFARIAEIEIDERKFRNVREFREYFGRLIRENNENANTFH